MLPFNSSFKSNGGIKNKVTGEQTSLKTSDKADGAFADRARPPLPALVLLDINVTKKSGLEVLEWIRQQSLFKSLPVVIFTSSSRTEDMEQARLLGADDYLLKPSDPLKLVDFVKSLHDRWFSQQEASARNQ